MARLSDKAGGIIQRVNAFARQRELSRQRSIWPAFVTPLRGTQTTLPAVTLQVLPARATPSGCRPTNCCWSMW